MVIPIRGLGGLGVAGAADVQALISQQAAVWGVPVSIALAVAQQESGFNQGAVGTHGEIGVYQLMPATAASLGVDPSNLLDNINGGLQYLAQNYQRFGDWGLALQAYNGGPSHVANGTVSTAAQNYAASILAAAGVMTTPEPEPVTTAEAAPPIYGPYPYQNVDTGVSNVPVAEAGMLPVPNTTEGMVVLGAVAALALLVAIS